ncbi:hypothetical protein EV178_001815 [Coemansia sp. RSA 1646]|nr:hypothetical protein EV178_001815 [Coemansia sp. RSA 1646]
MELVHNASEGTKLLAATPAHKNNASDLPNSEQRTPSPERVPPPPAYSHHSSSDVKEEPPFRDGQEDKADDDCSDIEGVDVTERALSGFESLDKNIFVSATNEGRKHEEVIPCHCHYNPERDSRDQACGETSDCFNRLIQMECNPLTCPCGSYCLNRRFQKHQYAKVRIIDAGRKGNGMQALEDLDTGSFIMEYMGEMVTAAEFRKRTRVYQSEGIQHHYFMGIGNGNIIDATRKGCIARFINHSCSPNCVLQKWMVGGAIRLGIFVERPIKRGEEITFDYKFERIAGSEPQPCYCGAPECKGIIGVAKERSKKGAHDINSGDDADEDVAGFINEEIEDSTVTRHQRDNIRRRHAAMDDDDEYDGSSDEDEYSGSDDDGRSSGNEAAGFKHIRQRARQKKMKKKKGLTSPEQVLKFVQIMHRSARQTRIIEILIDKLMETVDKRLLKSLIGLQGAGILCSWLQDYEGDDVMMIKILQCISQMPISTRNTIEETRLEDTIKPLCSYSDENVANLASELIDRWSSLRHVFKIPKKARKRSTSTTPAPGTPAASSKLSPNRKNTDTPPVPVHHNQNAGGSFVLAKEGGGRGFGAATPDIDPSVPPRWRHNSYRPATNYLPSRMRSASPSPSLDAGMPQGTQGYAAYGSNGEGERRGLDRSSTGYHRYGHSPSDPLRMSRPPVRESLYSGHRSRYEQPVSRSRSRSRSPNGLRRTASSYSRFSRFSGNDDAQGSGRVYGQYDSYSNSPSHRESRRDYSGLRSEMSPSSSFQRGKYSSWAGHFSYRQGADERAYSMDTDRDNRGSSSYERSSASRIRSSSGSDAIGKAYPPNAAQTTDMKLAPGWKTAQSDDGRVYYYHEVTKKPQWEPPLADPEPYAPSAASTQTNGAPYDQRSSLGIVEHQRQYNRQQHGRTGEPNGHALPSMQSPSSMEGDKANGFSRTKVDEIIERALRMGMISSSSAQGTPSASASSTTPNTQLVTPETDGEPTAMGGGGVRANVQMSTYAPGGSGKTGSSRKVSASSVSSSAGAVPPAKREKLEKKATSELAAFVVRAMSKYKGQLGHEEFKHEARKITKVLMEKERKAAGFDPHKLIELSQHKKTKIRQFIADYVNRLIDRQQSPSLSAALEGSAGGTSDKPSDHV